MLECTLQRDNLHLKPYYLEKLIKFSVSAPKPSLWEMVLLMPPLLAKGLTIKNVYELVLELLKP